MLNISKGKTINTFLLTAMVLVALVMVSCGSSSPTQEEQAKELNIYNWEDYFGEQTIANFEQEYGITVNLEYFESEDDMLSAVQSNPGKYDVVIISGSVVETMIALKLLSPLNLERIPNFVNLEQSFIGLPYDPENKYSVPYLWGTTGIAFNSSEIPEVTGWEVLWDTEHTGHLAMLDDAQEVMAAALKSLGYSINTTDIDKLEEAGRRLKLQKPLLAGYDDPLTIIDGLVSGVVWAAQLYNGDALSAAEENPDIEYVVPEEGALLWIDNLVVPADAEHKTAAETFINYILRPEVSAEIADWLYYATPNEAARELVDAQSLDDPAIYPPPQVMAKSEYYLPLGEEANRIINRIWSELKTEE